MKKFLLSLAVLLGATSLAHAVDIPADGKTWASYTFNAETDAKSGAVIAFAGEAEGFNIRLSKGTSSSDISGVNPASINQIRVYAGSNISIVAPEGQAFKKVTITVASSSKAVNATASEGWTLEGTVSTSAKSTFSFVSETAQSLITFDGDGKQLRIASLSILMDGEVEPDPEPDPEPVDISNTLETAYTTTQAIALINAGQGLDTEVYVKGNISEITQVSISYGNANYIISDGVNTLTVFRGYYFNGEKFTAEDQIKVGDDVVVLGKLTLYNTTYEVAAGSKIASLNGSTEPDPTPTPDPTVVNNIAEALALCTEAGTPNVTINAPVTVVYKNGRYMWITDATGSMLTYNGADAEIPAYVSGDVIPAGITGTAINYSNGLLQLKDLVASSFGTPTAGTAVAPIEVAVEEISVDLVSNFVVLPNVTIESTGSDNYTVTDATGTVALYNRFANAAYYDVVDVPEGSNLMLYAMVSVRDGVAQLLPVKVVSASGKDVCSAPEFSPASCELLKGATVTITSATEGATIHYTIDGTEPTSTSTVYSEPIIVVFDVTIKAIAVKEGFENSDVATATYTIKEVAPIEGTTATFNFSDPTTLDPAYTLDDCVADGSNYKVEKTQFDFYANGVSLSTTASGNGARIYYQSASEAWSYRIYKNSVTTFTVAEGYTLTGITFETQTASYATALGKCTFTEGTTFADGNLSIPNLASVTLTNPADGGATVGFTKIVVEFSDGSGGSGISDITIDNAPAEYFNLQGVPVRGDLTPGLYIRRQGNTATKVLVK